jgi:hypothetical protein
MYSHVKWSTDDINIMLTMVAQKKSFSEIGKVINRSPLSVKYKFGRFYRKNKKVPFMIVKSSDESSEIDGIVNAEEDNAEVDEGNEGDEDEEGEEDEEDEEDDEDEENEEGEEGEEGEEDDEDDEDEDEDEEDDACRCRKKRKRTVCDCDTYNDCVNGGVPQPQVHITYTGIDNTSFILTLCTGSMLGITFCFGLSMYIKILIESLNKLALINLH